jgi:FAD/FMN-containing dehydrogenase
MPYNIESLRQACQAADSTAEKVVYSTDSSTIKGEAIAVAWPSNLDELQRLMRIVTREKIVITLRGGGTSLVGGAVPQNSLVVDMSRFNKIKHMNPEERSVVVEAGVVLDELNNVLEGYGFEFPIQPGSHAAASIGGMIATNAAGMLSPKYGKIEGWIMALTIMDGTGKVFSLNDIESKEFFGTEGCCAIIVEAKLNLKHKDYNFSTDLIEFDNLNEMLNKCEELKHDNDILAIEYINKHAAKLSGMKPKEYLLVKYSGPKGKLKIGDDEEIWKLRENMYSVLVEKDYPRIEDPQIPAENMLKFLEWINQRSIPCYGHVGYGIIHPHFKRNQEDLNHMFDFLKEVNGKAAAEHGIGILKKKHVPFVFAQKIKILKEKYDPYNILNKGKII